MFYLLLSRENLYFNKLKIIQNEAGIIWFFDFVFIEMSRFKINGRIYTKFDESDFLNCWYC
jgi:hypothetical protein